MIPKPAAWYARDGDRPHAVAIGWRSLESPYRVEIVPELRRICVTARGHASFALAEQSIRDLTRNPLFEPAYGLLVDLREIEYLPTPEEARSFADLMSVFRGRIALVASRPASFGLARMVSIFSQLAELEVEAFTELEKATRWLAAPAGESAGRP